MRLRKLYRLFGQLLLVLAVAQVTLAQNGSLTGFAAGLDRKRFLLSLEEPPAEEAHRLF